MKKAPVGEGAFLLHNLKSILDSKLIFDYCPEPAGWLRPASSACS
jgi:hypothetical protein